MKRERVSTPDGDFLDLDWTDDPGDSAPVVLILHGLEGSSRRRYVRSVARRLLEAGVLACAMNFRGCSGTPNREPRFYHSGETADPAHVLGLLRRRFKGRRIGAIGFSLGGNVLLKLLGEHPEGGAGLVDCAAVMSVPYDLGAGCALLEESLMGRVYSEYFMRSLRGKIESKKEVLSSLVDVAAAEKARTIRDFDGIVTAPLNGFRSAEEYYVLCSSSRFLSGIRIPTLLLHATDDPFLPAEAIPVREVENNEHLVMSLHPKGGHVGFLSGSPRRPQFWGDETLVRFVVDRVRTLD